MCHFFTDDESDQEVQEKVAAVKENMETELTKEKLKKPFQTKTKPQAKPSSE